MSVEFVRVNATDVLQRGARYRLTYQKARFLGAVATSMPKIWERLPSLEPGAVVISPAPADGPVAVIDVKVPVTAPSMSVGKYALTLDDFTANDLTHMEAIDHTALSATQAAEARTAQTADALRERQQSSPFNVLGNLTGTVKLVAVAAIVVTLAVVAFKYLPAKRRGK